MRGEIDGVYGQRIRGSGQRMGGSGQRMGGSGQRVKKWAKSAFCGQRCNFVGQRNFIHEFLTLPPQKNI